MLNPATGAFENELRGHLPDRVFRPLTPAYLEERRGRYKGAGGLLLAPETTEQVSRIVQACNAARVAVVPYGGGTGLVGGQVKPDLPVPVILSLERMQALRGIWPDENLMVAEAGMVLEQVQNLAEDAGRLFPLSIASGGSARIGGVLSTNAGGVNVLRYGNARALCLGLEAVLPNGEIWHGLKRLHKDNTGYDLRDLLIGAEGTLGVITAAVLRLFARPQDEGAALMVVPSPKAALGLLTIARAEAGDMVSAFELISGQGVQFLRETMPDLRLPFAEPPEWMVLVDLGVSGGLKAQTLLEQIYLKAAEAGLTENGLIAQSETQRRQFWQMRETIPEANKRIGAVVSNDIALPLGEIPAFIDEMSAEIRACGPFRINCFGHLGDGNLHYNIFPEKGGNRSTYDDRREALKDMVQRRVVAMGGTISAEHGIGRLKVADLQRHENPAKLAAMRAIKSALDPNGIMNPGVVLSQSAAP